MLLHMSKTSTTFTLFLCCQSRQKDGNGSRRPRDNPLTKTPAQRFEDAPENRNKQIIEVEKAEKMPGQPHQNL